MECVLTWLPLYHLAVLKFYTCFFNRLMIISELLTSEALENLVMSNNYYFLFTLKFGNFFFDKLPEFQDIHL